MENDGLELVVWILSLERDQDWSIGLGVFIREVIAKILTTIYMEERIKHRGKYSSESASIFKGLEEGE